MWFCELCVNAGSKVSPACKDAESTQHKTGSWLSSGKRFRSMVVAKFGGHPKLYSVTCLRDGSADCRQVPAKVVERGEQINH